MLTLSLFGEIEIPPEEEPEVSADVDNEDIGEGIDMSLPMQMDLEGMEDEDDDDDDMNEMDEEKTATNSSSKATSSSKQHAQQQYQQQQQQQENMQNNGIQV